MKIRFYRLLSMGFLCASPFISVSFGAANPSDVVGRDLNISGLGWVGHVGIVTANLVTDPGNYVVEALNEPLVLQINRFSDFKIRSPYWGAKFGLINANAAGTGFVS